MKKLICVLLGIGAAYALVGCNNDVGDNNTHVLKNSSSNPNLSAGQMCSNPYYSQNNQSDNNLKDANFIMRMGSGVDSTTNSVVSSQSCLIAMQNCDTPYLISNPQALIDFSRRSDLSTLEQALGVDVSSKFGGDRFSFSAAANFANSSKDNKYSTNIIYLYKYAGTATFKEGALGEGNDALTNTAKDLIAHGDKTEFEEMCGDKFVSQMDAGAVLAVKLTLSFNSHSDQQKMEAQIRGDFGIANIATAIRQASASTNVHSELTLSAFQQGGEPQKLNDIFGRRSETGNYPMLDCGDPSKDANSCNAMIDAIVDYAQTMKQQLATSDSSKIDMQKLYYSNPVMQPWTSIQVRPYILHPSAELLHAMEQITSDYDNALADYSFAKHYLDGLDGRLSTTDKVVLTRVVDKLYKQLTEVYNAPVYHTMSCYKGYVTNDCLDVQKNIQTVLSQDKYKLDNLSTKIMQYLKTNSYGVDLYGLINKTDKPAPADYGLIKGCFMVPVSDWLDNEYALNCDGRWLTTSTTIPLTVEYDIDSGQLEINNLVYSYMINPFATPVYGSNMSYYLIDSPELKLKPELSLDGVYTLTNVSVYSSALGNIVIGKPDPKDLVTTKAKLKVTTILDNPA